MHTFSGRISHEYPGEKLSETTQRVLCHVWRPRSMRHFHQEKVYMSIHRNHQEPATLAAEQARDMPRLRAFLKLLRDERERDLGHFTPSVVNRQGMPAIGYFTDLGHAGILLLLLVGGMGDRPRHGVVVLAGEDQQRSTLGILGVDLGFRPRVEIGAG